VIVRVFIEIPIVSNYAFWVMAANYLTVVAGTGRAPLTIGHCSWLKSVVGEKAPDGFYEDSLVGSERRRLDFGTSVHGVCKTCFASSAIASSAR
jgi:hypothetical protein